MHRHDGGRAGSHRLDRGHAKRLITAAKNEHVRRPIVIGEILVLDERAKANASRITAFRGPFLQLSEDFLLVGIGCGATYRQMQHGFRVAGRDQRKRIDVLPTDYA